MWAKYEEIQKFTTGSLISKITSKLVTAFYFFLNRPKFKKRQIGALSSMKLAKIKHFLRART